jgi:hypothetical protein
MDAWRGLVQLWLILAVAFVLAIFAWDLQSFSIELKWARFNPIVPGSMYLPALIKLLKVSLAAMALSLVVLAAGAGLFWAYARFVGDKTDPPSN